MAVVSQIRDQRPKLRRLGLHTPPSKPSPARYLHQGPPPSIRQLLRGIQLQLSSPAALRVLRDEQSSLAGISPEASEFPACQSGATKDRKSETLYLTDEFRRRCLPVWRE